MEMVDWRWVVQRPIPYAIMSIFGCLLCAVFLWVRRKLNMML